MDTSKAAVLQRRLSSLQYQATDAMSVITQLKYEIRLRPENTQAQRSLQNKERELSNIKVMIGQTIAQLNGLNER